jgi:hypothetical protein
VYYIAAGNFTVAFLACCLVFWLFPDTTTRTGAAVMVVAEDKGWESDASIDGERLRSDIGLLVGHEDRVIDGDGGSDEARCRHQQPHRGQV